MLPKAALEWYDYRRYSGTLKWNSLFPLLEMLWGRCTSFSTSQAEIQQMLLCGMAWVWPPVMMSHKVLSDTGWSSCPGMGPEEAATSSLLGSIRAAETLLRHACLHLYMRTNRRVLHWDQPLVPSSRVQEIWHWNLCRQWNKRIHHWALALETGSSQMAAQDENRPNLIEPSEEIQPRETALPELQHGQTSVLTQQGKLIKDLHSGSAAILLIFFNGLWKIPFSDKSILPAPQMSAMLTLPLYQVSTCEAFKHMDAAEDFSGSAFTPLQALLDTYRDGWSYLGRSWYFHWNGPETYHTWFGSFLLSI